MLLERRKDDAVVPVQMDLTPIPGWESIDFGIRRQKGSKNRSGKEIADLILQAYRLRAQTPKSQPKPDTRAGPKAGSTPVDISRIIRFAPEELIGRETETRLLDDAWAQVQNGEAGRPRVLSFVALGGEGKTSLVAKWLADLAHRDWPGCDAAFAWSFYSQGTREQTAVSSDLFLAEALPGSATPTWPVARRVRSTRAGGWPSWSASGARC